MIICCVNSVKYWNLSKEELVSKYFLVEVKNEVNIGEPFKYNGKFYSPSCINRKEDYAIVKELTIREEKDGVLYERNITCPICGHEDGDSWENRDDLGEEECCYCGSKFSWERDVSVSYSTRLIQEHIIPELKE